MKLIVVAGVSGAIGYALAEACLARDEESRVIGLCREPLKVPEPLRSHSRVNLLAWDAEEEQSPQKVALALEKVIPASRGIDTFLYAAGLLHNDDIFPEKRLEDLKAMSMARAFAVNATGFATLAQALLPWLRHREFVVGY